MLTFCVHSSWKFLLIPPGEQSWSWISQHESSVSIRKLNKTWRFNCLTNLTEWNLVVQRLMWNGIGAFVIVGLSLFWILSNLNMFPICLCCNISFGLVPRPCLDFKILQNFSRFLITSNLWTHAWSIKYR
jgi:hypothetical protein